MCNVVYSACIEGLDKKERAKFDADLERIPKRSRIQRTGPGPRSQGTRQLLTVMGMANRTGGRIPR